MAEKFAGETFENACARRQAENKAFFASLSQNEALEELAVQAGQGFIEWIGGRCSEKPTASGRSSVLDKWLPRAVWKMANSVLRAASLYGDECTLEQAKEALSLIHISEPTRPY